MFFVLPGLGVSGSKTGRLVSVINVKLGLADFALIDTSSKSTFVTLVTFVVPPNASDVISNKVILSPLVVGVVVILYSVTTDVTLMR